MEISLRYKKCEYLVRIIGIFTCHVGTVISGVDEPPYPGEEYQNINHYPGADGSFPTGSGPAAVGEDYTGDDNAFGASPTTPDGPSNPGPEADSNGQNPAQPIVP